MRKILFGTLFLLGSMPLLANSSFVSVWQVMEDDKKVVLPIPRGFDYDFAVEWGDGTRDSVTSYDDPEATHTYEQVGTYTIVITGLVEAWSFWKIPYSKDRIVSITELGGVGWRNFFGAFLACANLTSVAGGDTAQVTDMRYMFYLADKAVPDTSGWDTTNVTRMDGMFWEAALANPEVSSWNTSKVTNMDYMFSGTRAATPEVSNWDVSQVAGMRNMFYQATSAAPDMSKWNFVAVKDMHRMFWGVTLPTEVYSNILIQLAATATQEKVLFHGGYSKYNAAAAGAREALIAKNWYLIDGGRAS